MEIKDKNGSNNVLADHLSRLENPTEDERGAQIGENFPDEQLCQVSVQVQWYADIVNYLAYGIMLPEFNYQRKRKLRTDARVYIWDGPLLFRRADNIIKRCILEAEQGEILDKCYASPYGGHFAGERIA